MSANLVGVRLWLTRYIMSIFVAFGLLGNIINICVFIRQGFRRNSCSLYLLAASTFNIFIIIWGNFQPLYTLNNTDISTYSYIYCKLRLYTIHTLLMIGRSLIVFACIDLYARCSQSIRLRSYCEPKIAYRVIIGNILIWPLLTIHIPLLQQFGTNRCYTTEPYSLIYGIYSTFAAGIVPPTLMTIFSLLMVRNRRMHRTRLASTNNNNKRDQTLMLMLSSEVLVYVISTSLYPGVTLYRAVTASYTKSTQSQQIEAFVSFLGGSFFIYLNSASVFYVFFIASKNFRKECYKMFSHLSRCITGNRSQIQPKSTVHFDTN